MKLRDVEPDDLGLYVRMRRDPVMMAELGGPLPREGSSRGHRGLAPMRPVIDGLEGQHCGPNGVSANRLTLVGAVADDYLHGRKI